MLRITALLLALALSSALAQRFEWRDVVQRIDIQANGEVIVSDERTLWTDDDFGEAFICVRLESTQRITLLDGSGAISPGPPATAFTQPCEGGTELVVRQEVRVAERRVRFVYRLEGSIDAYSDVVQWYWIILEQDRPPVSGYRLMVNAPGSMAAPFDAYVHRFGNPELPTVTLSNDRSSLTVSFNRVPSGDGVEIRYLMDPVLFTVRGTEPGFERLLREEAEIAGLMERQRQLAVLRGNPAWAVIALVVLGYLALGIWRDYRRFGREPQVETLHYHFEPPSDLPPAAVTALSSQHFSSSSMGAAFHATIMDLARRGYGRFTSQGRRFEMELNLEKSDEPLLPFEREVLGYLKSAAQGNRRGDPAKLEFNELRRYSERHAGSFMSRWAKKPRDWVEQRLGGPLTSPESRHAAAIWVFKALLGLAVCGLGVWLTLDVARVAFIAAAALCLLLAIVAGLALPAWRQEIVPEIYGWQGFKRTLSDFSVMKDAPDDFFMLWDRYYCYAAALGVAQQFLRNIARAAPLRGMDEPTLTSRAVWMGGLSSGNFSSLSSSITSLSSALSAASASASSGGSSSGGGGGGGGGRSGGR
ncbi:MAG: DUF2207 domain-containing protein [Truepera sp.]|nr:DUF2207 domain-containing protein [Truepera sp.]